MKLSIAKLGYSSNPWRVVDENGTEVWGSERFDHLHCGKTTIPAPLCGNTKTELIDKVLAVLAAKLEANQ